MWKYAALASGAEHDPGVAEVARHSRLGRQRLVVKWCVLGMRIRKVLKATRSSPETLEPIQNDWIADLLTVLRSLATKLKADIIPMLR